MALATEQDVLQDFAVQIKDLLPDDTAVVLATGGAWGATPPHRRPEFVLRADRERNLDWIRRLVETGSYPVARVKFDDVIAVHGQRV